MHLVELSVMEQRYQAVIAVVADGWKVTEVAARLGVSRQSVHRWVARYDKGGLPALADRSHRPETCAHQIPPETEAAICEIRRHARQRPMLGASTSLQKRSSRPWCSRRCLCADCPACFTSDR